MEKHYSQSRWSRREWLAATAGVAGLAVNARAAAAPVSPVAVAKCASYGAEVLPAMSRMFDQIGGISELVAGKTVAIKINMVNPLEARTNAKPAWNTRWTHIDVIAAAVNLFGKAGASKIRVLESSTEDDNPLEDNIIIGGGEPE